MRYYLGVDGGGSKTTAVICDEAGGRISSFVGGGINFNAVGLDAARKNLKETVAGALAGQDLPLSAAFIGLSALADRADAAITDRLCGGIIPCKNVRMDSDVFIALEAMGVDGACGAVICGTGSMAAGRLADGRVIHTGGWGHLLGDEGSGYALSLDAVKAAIRGAENSGPATALTDAVLSHFHITTIDGLIEIFYDKKLSRSELAAFAPTFFDCVDGGDGVAVGVMRNHARLLADTSAALLRRLPRGAPTGLWGGIFEHYPVFRDAFGAALRNTIPGANISMLPAPPVYGAVRAAMRLDGTEASE